jgi:hypothetical protein
VTWDVQKGKNFGEQKEEKMRQGVLKKNRRSWRYL